MLNFKEVTFSFKRSNCGPDIINVLCVKTTCVINQTIRRDSFWEKSLNLCFIVRFVEIHGLSFTSFWPEILRNFDCGYLICMKREDSSTEIYNKIVTRHKSWSGVEKSVDYRRWSFSAVPCSRLFLHSWYTGVFFLDYWEFNWALSIKAILKRSFVSIVHTNPSRKTGFLNLRLWP